MLTEDIIIQSEPEKQDNLQILEEKTYNKSHFEKEISDASTFGIKFLQRVRFCFICSTTRQILE